MCWENHLNINMEITFWNFILNWKEFQQYQCQNWETIVEVNGEYSLWSWRELWTSLINVTRPPPIIIDINYLLRPLTLLLLTFLPYLSIFSHYGRFFYIINAFNANVQHSLATSYKILLHEMTSAWKSPIGRFVITEKAPTRDFSWLKAATTAFTFKTLLSRQLTVSRREIGTPTHKS